MADDPQKLFSTLADQYPEPTGADTTYTAIKTIVSSVPLFGPITAETVGHFFATPLEERRNEYLKMVADMLEQLRNDFDEHKSGAIKVEDLQNNEIFVSAVLQGARVAAATHQASKRDMLRNALLNVALGTAPDEDQIQLFLQMIETMTSTQISLLNYFWNPRKRLKEHFSDFDIQISIPLDKGIEAVFPQLRNKGETVTNAIRDLYNRGLIPFNAQNNVLENATITTTGTQFLNFVLQNPLEKQ